MHIRWMPAALLLAVTWLLAVADARAAEPPRLVVVVSIDQFPHDYLVRMRDGFSPTDGLFLELLDRGAVFTNCHHAHAMTYTAPGHSVMLTGAYPSSSGIIDNDWFDRRSGKSVYCVADDSAPLVGAVDAGEGISPRNLGVDTVGDVLKLATGGSAKVFGVALKDRGAVLMAGHLADAAFWFDAASGNWVTSTYYRRDLPGYLRVYNESGAARQYAAQTWELLLPEKRYHLPYPDDSPFETNVAPLGRAFPHRLPDAADKNYYRAMPTSPFGNEMTLAVARLVVQHEQLGRHELPDLLCVSLSSNDYVGHAYGPHSLEVQDMTFRTDRQLRAFARFIEEHLAGSPWVLAITSDHGVGPVPEYARQLGLPAARNPLGDLKALGERLEALLSGHFGSLAQNKRYVQRMEDRMVYLTRELPELAGNRLLEAQRLVRDALLAEPAVTAAYTREHLLAGVDATPLGRSFSLAFHPGRSGDVLFATAPYTISGSAAATHGSPWQYDTHVALLIHGHGVRGGHVDRRVSPAHLAPTVARLLGINPPAGCAVEPLREAISQ